MTWASIVVVPAEMARDQESTYAYLVETAEAAAEQAAEVGLELVGITSHTIERAYTMEAWGEDGEPGLVGEAVARLLTDTNASPAAVVARIQWETKPLEPGDKRAP